MAPVESAPVVIDTGGLMVSEKVFVLVAPGSVTRASKVKVPEADGLPLSTPDELRVTPEGKAPA